MALRKVLDTSEIENEIKRREEQYERAIEAIKLTRYLIKQYRGRSATDTLDAVTKVVNDPKLGIKKGEQP